MTASPVRVHMVSDLEEVNDTDPWSVTHINHVQSQKMTLATNSNLLGIWTALKI